MSVKMAKALLKLFKVSPSGYAAEHTVEELGKRAGIEYDDEKKSGFLGHFDDSGQMIQEKNLLDIGSGYGGRTVRYAELGAKSAIGVEISYTISKIGADFASKKSANAYFVTSVGEQLPFKDETFDIITSYDVLEHVQNPRLTLTECFRVLKYGGRMMVIFPPYYSPLGSHLSGYISLLPYANLIFPPKILMTAIDQLLEEEGTGYRPMALRPGDKIYTLNGLTVRSFMRIARTCGFSFKRIHFQPLVLPRFSIGAVKDIFIFGLKIAGLPLSILSFLLCGLPGFREILAAKIVCVLKK